MNYPNPFSGQTNFSYELTEDARDAQVNIFTLAGRLIKTIYGASNAIGYNFKTIWDGTDDDGDRVANGVYIYKVEAISVSGAKAEAYGKAVVMH
jgi:flagellar hook assembly protein FlgD